MESGETTIKSILLNRWSRRYVRSEYLTDSFLGKGIRRHQTTKNKKAIRQFTKADIDNFHLIYHLVKEKGMTLKGAQMKLRENKAETETNFEVVKRLKAIKEELLQIKDQLQ